MFKRLTTVRGGGEVERPSGAVKGNKEHPMSALRYAIVGRVQDGPVYTVLGRVAGGSHVGPQTSIVLPPVLITAWGDLGDLELPEDVLKVGQEPRACQSAHVLKDDRSRVQCPYRPHDFWEQIALITVSAMLPSQTERLAWSTGSQEVDPCAIPLETAHISFSHGGACKWATRSGVLSQCSAGVRVRLDKEGVPKACGTQPVSQSATTSE